MKAETEEKEGVSGMDILIWAAILLLIFGFILLGLLQEAEKSGKITEKSVQCVARNSVLYTTSLCGKCAEQKQLLYGYKNYFHIIDCIETPEECTEITSIPTWRINLTFYRGTYTLNELKELTGC